MLMAVVLALVVACSLLFHFVNPWGTPPLASNWGRMDDMLMITLVITGIFFVAINLLIVYILLRFRHRDQPMAKTAAHPASGHVAAYIPENKKLERRLILGTGVAIMVLLAPGLVVYADYVNAPKEAMTVEVLGQQWQWRYRFPDVEGRLGKSDVRFVSGNNPFGLDPADPAGRDNVLIDGDELHLPLGKPVKLLFRSNDVLHDFYVPQFRARMNMVPGMITSFWFTPEKAGRYEVLCAQLCGLGHANMRSYVVVENDAAFQTWLKRQPTFAMSMAAPPTPSAHSENVAGGVAGALVEQGRSLAQSKGCVACHSVDGRAGVGPTWAGLYGKTESMADGTTALVDEAYLRSFIRNPQSRTIKGFAPIMPAIELSDAELTALIAYIRSHQDKDAAAGVAAQK